MLHVYIYTTCSCFFVSGLDQTTPERLVYGYKCIRKTFSRMSGCQSALQLLCHVLCSKVCSLRSSVTIKDSQQVAAAGACQILLNYVPILHPVLTTQPSSCKGASCHLGPTCCLVLAHMCP